MTEPVGDPVVDPPATDPVPPAPVDRSFTADDVERIVRERLARAKNTPPADYDDLKTKAAEFDKLQEANKSELEKAQAKAEQALKDSEAAIERANTRLIEAAVLAEATAQKAMKPEHLHRLIDTGEVTVSDDGEVTGVKEAVEGFLKANPEYVGTGRPGGADQGARGASGVKQLTRADLQTMSPDDIVKARREGRTAVLEGRT